jgi:hypothetical protein
MVRIEVLALFGTVLTWVCGFVLEHLDEFVETRCEE